MTRLLLLLPLLGLAGLAGLAGKPPGDRFVDGFESGLCLGACRGRNWAASQQIDGSLAVVPARGGKALLARTGPRIGRVPKAALIARPAKLAPGATARIGFDLMVPAGAPLNSIHLVDIECAACGEAGNPGIRLYLRHGRLRVDRAKIGWRDAWANPGAAQLRSGRWHRIEFEVAIGFGTAGGIAASLDGATVLSARGDTILRPARPHSPGADRIQIGLTASSNAVPAMAYFDNVTVDLTR